MSVIVMLSDCLVRTDGWIDCSHPSKALAAWSKTSRDATRALRRRLARIHAWDDTCASLNADGSEENYLFKKIYIFFVIFNTFSANSRCIVAV